MKHSFSDVQALIFLTTDMYANIIYIFSHARTHTHYNHTSLGKKMRINLNITFPSLACEDIHVDALDVAGDAQVNIEGDTFVKRRLHLDGTPMGKTELTAASRLIQRREEEKRKAIVKGLAKDYCGPCYGAQKNETDCCQTCDDVIAAYKEKKWNSNDLLRVAEQCIREGRQKIDIKKLGKNEGCNLDGYMLVNRVSSLYIYIYIYIYLHLCSSILRF